MRNNKSTNWDLIACGLEGVWDTPAEIEKGRAKIHSLLWGDGTKTKPPKHEEALWGKAATCYAKRSTFFSINGDGSSFSGESYCVDDTDFAVSDSDGDVYFKSGNGNYEFVTNPEIRKLVLGLRERDHEISIARSAIAQLYSEGDPILGEAIRMHLEFSDGRLQPFFFQGIPFFKVGRNATHEFYAGAKDGKRQVLCCWTAYDRDENGNADGETERTDFSLDEAGEEWGYIGHF
jgi:hypothetical protein